MTKYFAIGLLAFVALCTALAPADLLRPLLAQVGLSLSLPFGTIWSGGGDLRRQRAALGSGGMYFDPAKLTEPAIAYDWKVFAEQTHVHRKFRRWAWTGEGGCGRRFRRRSGQSVAGRLRPAAKRPIPLVRSGSGLRRAERPKAPPGISNGAAVGSTTSSAAFGLGRRCRHWPLVYNSPCRAAPKTPRINAQVLTSDEALPLIQVESTEGGYVEIGVTRRLMKMANVPWLGEGADDAVALTLEEKLF